MDLAVRAAARALRAGGLIVHPTEAVFGLAACAGDREACDRVRRAKQRPHGKPFIVIAASVEQLGSLVELHTPHEAEVLESWPGPHTWILPARRQAPPWLHSRGAIAVRVTAHEQAAALCRAAGPLVSTSANPASRPPARSLLAARSYFGAAVDYYLPGILGGLERPTPIRDGSTGVLLRP